MNRRERKARARERKAAGVAQASTGQHPGAESGAASDAPAKAHGDKYQELIPRAKSGHAGTNHPANANEE